jgi:hypothetical protein
MISKLSITSELSVAQLVVFLMVEYNDIVNLKFC